MIPTEQGGCSETVHVPLKHSSIFVRPLEFCLHFICVDWADYNFRPGFLGGEPRTDFEIYDLDDQHKDYFFGVELDFLLDMYVYKNYVFASYRSVSSCF